MISLVERDMEKLCINKTAIITGASSGINSGYYPIDGAYLAQ
jgi:hypothetical protein